MRPEHVFVAALACLVLASCSTSRQELIAPVQDPAHEAPSVFSVRKIVLDAGHGGKDTGAIGVKGVLEKDVTLAIAEKLKRKLLAQGLQVEMIREKDYFLSLEERVGQSNRANACFLIGIHCNAAKNSQAKGVEIYYASDTEEAGEDPGIESASFLRAGNEAAGGGRTVEDLIRIVNCQESYELARSISASLKRDLSIRIRGSKSGSYFLLKNSVIPAVLIELGFLSNPGEAEKMADPFEQDRLAGLVADGILAYKAEYEKTRGFTANE